METFPESSQTPYLNTAPFKTRATHQAEPWAFKDALQTRRIERKQRGGHLVGWLVEAFIEKSAI